MLIVVIVAEGSVGKLDNKDHIGIRKVPSNGPGPALGINACPTTHLPSSNFILGSPGQLWAINFGES